MLLPSALAPEYANAGLHQTWEKLQHLYPAAFADQWGFPDLHGTWLGALTAMCVVGMVVRIRRHAALDLPIAVFALLSVTIAGMIPAYSDRYLMGLTPFAVYFAAQAVAELPLHRVRIDRRVAPIVATVVLSLVAAHHLTEYPSLVEGIDAANDASGRKLKFLRRIPIDPMTHGTEWGLRSYQDDADSTRWGGENVFDGVNFDIALGERGGAVGINDVLDARFNLRLAIQIHAPEANARAWWSGKEV